ncbi:MAG: cation-efflux pump [Candidatus Bathyarchaeota archaeon]|nr:cation-efflux pump [Candidatus Bathyarchaeota archaeon]
MQSNTEGKNKLKALKISAIAIFSVVIVEITVGSIVNSLAIISDGLHALLDALSSVMLFFAVRASLKPPDEEHTYGHEKFETIGGLMGGIVLIGVALLIFYEAATRLVSGVQLVEGVEYAGFIGIGYALAVASLRVTVFRRWQHAESTSMKAGLYDAISDLSSTLIALLGFGLATLGFTSGDAVASIFLGVMLTYLSIKLVRASVMELSDSASKEIVSRTRRTILDCDGVVKVENLKVRKVSSKVFVEASVQVPKAMSLESSHSLASKIEQCLTAAFGNVDATIHVEPSVQEDLCVVVTRLASVEGVKQVHEVKVNYVDGKPYITLHASVDPELSVEEAHRIAEAIEQRINGKIKPKNVTVHVEPAGIDGSTGDLKETQIRNVVYEVAHTIAANLQVKRVMIYQSEGTSYVNIDCCFTRYIRIKEAHRIASLLEKETKERFADMVVTVHIEPQKT